VTGREDNIRSRKVKNIHYVLDADNKVVEADLLEWAKFFENTPRRIVAVDQVREGVTVSTVFLGIDHRFVGEGPPIVFETMVFRDGDGDEQMRYATWEEAERGHLAMVRKVLDEEE
jgi:hypothetical protein